MNLSFKNLTTEFTKDARSTQGFLLELAIKLPQIHKSAVISSFLLCSLQNFALFAVKQNKLNTKNCILITLLIKAQD